MRILVTGGNGQVGYELRRVLAPLGEVIAPGRDRCDMASADSVRACIREIKPGLIVNAAAYTAVDKAEQEPDLAMAVNGIAPGVMAEEANSLGAALIHYSTDYVFDGSKGDGSKGAPYVEDDAACPINVYGETKWAGEEAVRNVAKRYLILRTSWVYGVRGHNFLLTIRRLAKERQELNIVADQFGSPTWSRLIAETTGLIIAHSAGHQGELLADCAGTYHLTSSGQTSWHGFARALLELDPDKSSHQLETLGAINTEQYPTPAQRPKYSVLNNGKLARQFGLRMPDWHDCLELASAG